MNSKNRYFLFGIAVIALTFGIAAYFSWDNGLKTSSSQPNASNQMTVKIERVSSQPQVSRSATVQQMIDSGQFAPPPGNTETMSSSVSPFSSGTRTASSGMSQNVKGNGQEQTWLQQAAAVMFSSRSDKIAAAVVRQDSPSVSATAQAQSAAPAQLQSGLPQFETPPGIGSAKGGQ